MAINFPTSLDTIVDHTTILEAAHISTLQAKIGINASAVTTSHDYMLANGIVRWASCQAGEALAEGDFVYLKSDGKYYKADANDSTKMPVIAMATATISSQAYGTLLRRGRYTLGTWAWATPGGPLYASGTLGGATLTAPSTTGDQVQRLGIALAATIIDFDPQLDVVEVP